MKHLKFFTRATERINFEKSFEYSKPYVSLVEENEERKVHYNREIKIILKLTKENGDVINITNDKDLNYIRGIISNIRDSYTKLEVFSGIEEYWFYPTMFTDWKHLKTIIINENVTQIPILLTFNNTQSSLNNLVIYGKNIKDFFISNCLYLVRTINNNLNIYVDESNVAELEQFKLNNLLNYNIYTLDRYHD